MKGSEFLSRGFETRSGLFERADTQSIALLGRKTNYG